MVVQPHHEPAFPADWSLLDLVVRGARVEMMPTHGFTSCDSILQVAEDDAPLVVPKDALNLVQQTGDRVIPEYIPLARFAEGTPTSRPSWSCIAGTGDYVSEVGAAVEAVIANAGAWPDLATMFRTRYGHDPLIEFPMRQPTIRWSWLAGQLGTRGAEAVRLFEEEGLYVDPSTRRIPVFTNRLDAVRLARRLQPEGVSLQMYDIPCLGCFMTGVASELGRERVRGALIDGQWNVQFFTCSEHGADAPSHFVLKDGAASYHLIGCAERGWPRWAEARWKGNSFQVPCSLEAW